jgi:hypothetical protein
MNNSDSAAKPSTSRDPVRHVSKVRCYDHDQKLYGGSSPKLFLPQKLIQRMPEEEIQVLSHCGEGLLKALE